MRRTVGLQIPLCCWANQITIRQVGPVAYVGETKVHSYTLDELVGTDHLENLT